MIDQAVTAAELRAALRAAFAELPARCRKLLSPPLSGPPISYAEISARLSPSRASARGVADASTGCAAPSLAAFTDSDLQASVAGSAPSRDTGGVPSA